MGVTKRKLISDIELRVTNAKPSDDLSLPKEQISYWLDVQRDALVANYLNDLGRKGQPISSEYLSKQVFTEFDGVDVDGDSYVDDVSLLLDKKPLNLLNDAGIVRVVDNGFREYHKRDLHNIQWLKDLKYCQPDTDTLTYHRENLTLIVQGLVSALFNYDTVTVYYVTSYVAESPEFDDEFVIDENLLDILLEEVEMLARREIYETAEDLENDGEQDLN